MAKNLRTISEIQNAINESIVVSFLENLSEEVFQRWYSAINDDWYSVYEPVIYNRTYAILKSLMKSKITKEGSYMKVSIYIDESEMSRYHPNSQSSAYPETVLDIIESEGMTLRNGIERKPSYAYENTLEWLRENYESYVNSYIKTLKIT